MLQSVLVTEIKVVFFRICYKVMFQLWSKEYVKGSICMIMSTDMYRQSPVVTASVEEEITSIKSQNKINITSRVWKQGCIIHSITFNGLSQFRVTSMNTDFEIYRFLSPKVFLYNNQGFLCRTVQSWKKLDFEFGYDQASKSGNTIQGIGI